MKQIELMLVLSCLLRISSLRSTSMATMPKLGLILTLAFIACQLASGSVIPAPESSTPPGFSPEQMNQLSGICFTAFRLMLDQTSVQQHVKPLEAIQHEEKVTPRNHEEKVTPRKVIPPNFEQIGLRYFYISEVGANWFAAERTCRQMGGQLATIQDEEELNAIRDKILLDESYWLDLNDLVTNGEFVSWTSGKKAPFYKWYDYNSENKHDNEHCVNLFKGEMFHEACNLSYRFICQELEDK